MPSKVYAISKPSAAIALKYGENVSKGIQEMERVIDKQREELKKALNGGSEA